MTTTCTVVVGAAGTRCGKPAVHTFTGRDGTAYHECADHTTDHVAVVPGHGCAVGDVVTVRRYGREYRATVTRVGARGAVYATFTYGKGTTRTVRVDA